MKLETRVVVDSNWIGENMSWLQSALRAPMNEEEKAEFIANARLAFLGSAQAVADAAFNLGVEHGKRNPR